MIKKMNKFRRFVTFLTIFGFMFTQISFAYAQRLAPQTFEKLYELASVGDLDSIKYAMARGLNVNSVNRYGNTGICEAILRGDYRAYNTFYAAGANPKPACVYQIESSQYQGFMASRYTVPLRESVTYGTAEYSTTSIFGVLAGTAVVGGLGYWGYKEFIEEDDKEDVYVPPVEPVDLCENVDCGTGGVCNEATGICECAFGYETGVVTGECIPKGECEGDTNCAYMSGVCNVQTNQCVCADGYVTNAQGICIADACFGVDCGDNGTCNAESGTPICECTSGYSGTACEIAPLACTSETVKCGNYGTCYVDSASSSLRCSCDNGTSTSDIPYESGPCPAPPVEPEPDLPWCQVNENPCLNGGSCISDGSFRYDCSCPSDYKGDHCEITCLNADNTYKDCNAPDGTNDGTCTFWCASSSGGPDDLCTTAQINGNSYLITTAGCKCDDGNNVEVPSGTQGTCASTTTISLGKTEIPAVAFDGSQEEVIVVEAKLGEENNVADILGYVEETAKDGGVIKGVMKGVVANVDSPQKNDTKINLGNIGLENNTDNDVKLTAVEAITIDENTRLDVYLAKGNHININNNYFAADNTPNVIGIKTSGYSAYAQNDGNIIIQGKNNLYGVLADDQSVVLNNGGIIVAGDTSYGMYARNNSVIINQGSILVDGNNSFGMYADNATLINTGMIEIEGENSIGIAAINSSDVLNTGTITINGELAPANCSMAHNCGNYIQVDATSTFTNNGVMSSDGDIDLSDFAGREVLIIGKDSQIEAEGEISGDAMISSSVVLDGQEDVYTINNAFSADNIDVNLYSQSVFFSADLVKGGASVDAQLRRINFKDVLESQALAQYLEQNYGSGHFIYNDIMVATSGNENVAVNDALGVDMISNFAQQNMDVFKSLNYNIENNIIKKQDFNKDENIISGYTYFSASADADGDATGYNDDASSLFVMFDKRYNSNWRYGIGGAFTKYESDYYDGSNRDENAYHFYGMIAYKQNDWTLLSMSSIGAGFGEYDRRAGSNFYEADTSNYYYSLSNSLRKSIAFADGYVFEPMLALNFMGVYQDKTKEADLINVDDANNVSVDVGFGMYLSKEYKFDENQVLSFRIGGIAYYELVSNPFADMNTNINGMSGYYVIDPRREDRDRQAFSANVVYRYQNIDINADFSKYIDSGIDNGYSFGVALKYNF